MLNVHNAWILRFLAKLYCRFVTCLQVRRDAKADAFSLHEALFNVLVQNKVDFVHLFMERIDLKTFLDEKRLNRLYNEVFKIAYMHNYSNLRITMRYFP